MHVLICRHRQDCPQHLLPLFTDILQYYLACSPRATNPFQQVRARLVLGGQGQRHRVREEAERAMSLSSKPT